MGGIKGDISGLDFSLSIWYSGIESRVARGFGADAMRGNPAITLDPGAQVCHKASINAFSVSCHIRIAANDW